MRAKELIRSHRVDEPNVERKTQRFESCRDPSVGSAWLGLCTITQQNPLSKDKVEEEIVEK